jgi:hypothetical protein
MKAKGLYTCSITEAGKVTAADLVGLAIVGPWPVIDENVRTILCRQVTGQQYSILTERCCQL